jgi:NADPH-dependent 2,4-dienoyl-CoA reductase/sulfur reductase-like enzyme
MDDAVIVAGGPTGMAAALAPGRVHRTVLVIDADEGRNARADNVHNFLTCDEAGKQAAVLGAEPARVRLALQPSRFAAQDLLGADFGLPGLFAQAGGRA